jgi:hypothetical protein
VAEAWSRGRWLLGLLVLQSMSSFVLDSYQDLLKEHLVVTLFLTMLVGAGGNAGNQSAIKIIRGLATGSFKPTAAGIRRAMKQQASVGLMLGLGLAAGGWVRVYITNGDALNATAISISLFLIVLCSVLAGTGESRGSVLRSKQTATSGLCERASACDCCCASTPGLAALLRRLAFLASPPLHRPGSWLQGCPLRWRGREWTQPMLAPASK